MNFTENSIFTVETRTVADLVRAAQSGDRDAFGELFERYRPGIVALAMRRVRNADEAEELANLLVDVATRLGVNTTALISDMNQPIGTVGNAIEVEQGIAILKNEMHFDTITLAMGLGAELLQSAGLTSFAERCLCILWILRPLRWAPIQIPLGLPGALIPIPPAWTRSPT